MYLHLRYFLCGSIGLLLLSISPVSAQDKLPQAVDRVRQILGTLTDQAEIKDENFTLLKDDQQGVSISGVAQVFGVREVVLRATLGNALTSLEADFPRGAGASLSIGGQYLNSWLPGFLQQKLDLTSLTCQIFPQEDNRLTLSATISQPAGQSELFAYQGFSISQPQVDFGLERNSATTVSVRLGGAIVLGGLQFNLAGTANANKEWTLSGTIQDLKVLDFVRNTGQWLGVAVPPMPGPVEDFSIQQASLTLNSDQSARFRGVCDLGQMEAYLAKNPGTGNAFLLGFSPNTDYQLARISSALKPVDDLGLSDLALVYAMTPTRADQGLELLQQMSLGSLTVKPGLTLLGGFDLPDDLPGMTEKGKVLMRANLPPTLAGAPTLQAGVQFNGLQLGDAFRINEAFLQLAPVDLSFGAGLSLGANFDGNWLNFSGMGEVAPPATFGLVVYMEDGSVWKKPFGLPGIEISQLGLDVGADILSPLPRPRLGLRGAMRIGPFAGEAAGMVNTANPLESLIAMKMNELGLQQFINAFVDTRAKAEINKLPTGFRDTGLKDVEIMVVPKPLTMAGRQYNPGLRLKGQGNLIGLAARLDLNATFDSGLAGVATVAPILIREGNTTIFQLSGVNAADSLRLATDLTVNNLLNPVNPMLFVDGKLALLGFTAQAKVEFGRSGFYFATSANIFGKFQTSLDAKGGNILNSQDFYLRAAMQNDLIAYLNRETTAAIDQATKASQQTYRKAKEDLRSSEEYLRNTQADVDAFNRQKAKVDDAQADVNRMERDVSKAKRECDKAPWYRKADKCAKYGTLKGSLETAKGVLSGYRKTLDGLSKAVDWSKRNIAANTVAASRGVIAGFERATTGTMKAAKWIVDKGLGGVADIKSAEFEGQLNAVQGGQVRMKINTKFLNEDFNAQLGFNFNNPVAAAQELANALVNDRAPRGFAPQISGQIGTGYGRK